MPSLVWSDSFSVRDSHRSSFPDAASADGADCADGGSGGCTSTMRGECHELREQVPRFAGPRSNPASIGLNGYAKHPPHLHLYLARPVRFTNPGSTWHAWRACARSGRGHSSQHVFHVRSRARQEVLPCHSSAVRAPNFRREPASGPACLLMHIEQRLGQGGSTQALSSAAWFCIRECTCRHCAKVGLNITAVRVRTTQATVAVTNRSRPRFPMRRDLPGISLDDDSTAQQNRSWCVKKFAILERCVRGFLLEG